VTSPFKKFLDVNQIEDVISEARFLAGEQGVSIAVIGGVALRFYGSDRMTKDIDFVANAEFGGISDEKSLNIGGF
jgi:hypothetical protein